MAVTTFCVPDDLRHASDPDILEALAVCRRAPVVNTVPIWVRRHWWQRRQEETWYEVLWPLGTNAVLDALGAGHEYQVVNFYEERTENSINLVVTKALVLAYLYGISAGEHTRERLMEEG